MLVDQSKIKKIEAVSDRGIVFAFCALIFCLPASIALVESFAGLAIFCYIVKKISQIIAYRICPAPVPNALNWPLGILTLATFISVLHSQYLGVSLFAFLAKFGEGVFLYFSFIEAFTTPRRIKLFLGAFLFSALLAALSGFIQHYTHRDFLRQHPMNDGRVTSAFRHANGFGAYLILVFGFVSGLFLLPFSGFKKPLLIKGTLGVLLFLVLACLDWTYSRGAWSGFLVLLFFMAWMDYKKIIYAGIMLLIFIFVFIPSLHKERSVSLFTDNINQNKSEIVPQVALSQTAGSGRYDYWKKAVSVIDGDPVWGTGLNTYTRIIKRDDLGIGYGYAHNCYLQMAAETGLVGLGCFLWMLSVLFVQGVRRSWQMEDAFLKAVLQGALCGLLGLLVHSFFDTILYAVQLDNLMWVIMGFIVAVMQIKTFRQVS